MYNVLFLCTHNSARSILAEALLNHAGAGRFSAYSAGSMPAAAPNPLALETLARLNVPVARLYSKGWDVFAADDAPAMDFVVTVCDDAADETCPVWPGHPVSAHWGVEDPSRLAGDDNARRLKFLEVAGILRHRIDLLVRLPLDTLDKLSTLRQLRAIGDQ